MKTKGFTSLFYLFGFLVITLSVFAQSNRKINRAEDFVRSGKYEQAQKLYKEVLATDSLHFKANLGLGLLYFEYLDDKENAFTHLSKALRKVNPKDSVPELYLAYAECLQFNYRYEDAIKYYERSLSVVSNDAEGQLLKTQINRYIENCRFAMKSPMVKNLVRYKVKNMGSEINSKFPDYVPVLTEDENILMFTSRRNTTTGGKKDNKDEKYFEDMFITRRKNGKFEPAIPFNVQDNYVKALANSPDHDAVVSMSSDGNKLFTYKNNGLYLSEKSGDSWQTPVRLPEIINAPQTFEAHACISRDGNTIYFSSNKPGGFGGLDIYKSVKGSDGNWMEPENLGEDVNTPENEDSPFLSYDEKYLYFSSNGLMGYGGFDIYKIDLEKKTGNKPVNIGPPFNSPSDDIYFSINKEETHGYLSSSRAGGYGEMDIYRVFYYDKPIEKQCRTLTSQIPNEDFYIDFTFKDSIFVNDSIVMDAGISRLKNGTIIRNFWKINDTLVNEDSTKINWKFLRPGYFTVTLETAIFSDTANDRMDFCVSKTVHVIDPKVIDAFFEPLVKKDEEKMEIKGTVVVENIKLDPEKKDVLKIKLDPVFFDTDKFNLRKDALATINKNVAKMKVDPNIVIKLTAHTDPRASKEYNLKLSQKRANSVVDFLVSKGIKKNRILAVLALGEAEVIEKNCGNDEKCKEKMYQQNRRVEFKIVGSEAKKVLEKKQKNSGTAKKAGTKPGAAKKPAPARKK